MNKTVAHILGGGAALALTAFAFFSGAASAVLVLPQTPAEVTQHKDIVLADGALAAKAAILLDAKTGDVLYQKNANTELPLASITKLMSAYVVLNNRPIEEYVEVRPEDVATEGESGLKAGEYVKLSELLRLSLVASSNDAIAAAAGSLGPNAIAQFNATAKDLGLTKTSFKNPTGLDVDARTPGAVGSAYDVARLAVAFYAAHPEFFEQTQFKDVSIDAGGETVTDNATSEPLFSLPGLIASKTGTTDLAGANLVAVVDLDIGRPVVGVILGSTAESRFPDMKKLIEAAREQL